MAAHLSLELARRGWRVVVASLYDGDTPISRELEAAGVCVRHLGKRAGLDLSMVPKLRALVAAERPACVHSHLYASQYTFAARAATAVPEVHTVHNMARNEVPRRLQTLQRAAFSRGYCTPVAICPSVRDSIRSLYGLAEKDVPLVCNGIPEAPAPCSPPSLPGDPRAFAFLSIGRLATQKNQAALIHAFSRFHATRPATKLCIIGEGPLEGELAALIDELGVSDSVFLLGAKACARDYLAAADAFVLPSLYEGMPMTLIEAMMAGAPVLASDRGGSPDMVADGATGYLCEPDEAGIEAGLARVFEDPGRAAVAARGKAASAAWTAGAMADGYEALYLGGRD
jgi:glycosyltransferase involved in cell wall biosynthesis